MESNPDSVYPRFSEIKPPISEDSKQNSVCWDGLERRKDTILLVNEVRERLDRQDHLLLQFHDDFIAHLVETKQTKDLVNELLELYKGSKFLVTVFKFFVPIVAAIAALFLWIKEHLK